MQIFEQKEADSVKKIISEVKAPFGVNARVKLIHSLSNQDRYPAIGGFSAVDLGIALYHIPYNTM
jgi:hypothetical protein